MTTKCYIVSYDNKLDKYRKLLSSMNQSLYQRYPQYKDETQNDMSDNLSMRRYLKNIDNYLDEILNNPDISDEEIYNVKKDQAEILKSIDSITDNIKVLQSSIGCPENTNVVDFDKETPNITININGKKASL